jgi:hypothetical protein
MKMFGSRKGLILGLVITLFAMFLSVPLYNLANFNYHLDDFSAHIKNGDSDGAERSLEQLRSDYNYLVDMKLRYFADNYWFADTFLHETSIAYLNDDCDLVERLLDGHGDDYRSAFFAGLCKYKLFKEAYRQAKTDKEKNEILDRASERITPDFEKCVKDGPGIDKNFNCSFDYDMVSDPDALKSGFEIPIVGPRFVLGIPVVGRGGKPGTKAPLGQKPDDTPGSGNLKKGG